MLRVFPKKQSRRHSRGSLGAELPPPGPLVGGRRRWEKEEGGGKGGGGEEKGRGRGRRGRGWRGRRSSVEQGSFWCCLM